MADVVIWKRLRPSIQSTCKDTVSFIKPNIEEHYSPVFIGSTHCNVGARIEQWSSCKEGRSVGGRVDCVILTLIALYIILENCRCVLRVKQVEE